VPVEALAAGELNGWFVNSAFLYGADNDVEEGLMAKKEGVWVL
jgi:hypothetical protein